MSSLVSRDRVSPDPQARGSARASPAPLDRRASAPQYVSSGASELDHRLHADDGTGAARRPTALRTFFTAGTHVGRTAFMRPRVSRTNTFGGRHAANAAARVRASYALRAATAGKKAIPLGAQLQPPQLASPNADFAVGDREALGRSAAPARDAAARRPRRRRRLRLRRASTAGRRYAAPKSPGGRRPRVSTLPAPAPGGRKVHLLYPPPGRRRG
jgi:hypothetical protein